MDAMLRRDLLALFAFAAFACHSPSDPLDSPVSSGAHGRLSGTVTIGPNCPGPTTSVPCPTPPEAYKTRKILVYNEAKTVLLHTVDIDSNGHYEIDLAPARYTIDLQGSAADMATGVPVTIEITANAVVVLNVSVDTGIR